MSKRADYVIGMGANLGPRLENMRKGLLEMAGFCHIVGISKLYETVAVGPPQPDYLNAAIRVHSASEPIGLLRALLEIESGVGRIRRERWGPRTLDLDILWLLNRRVVTADLEVPHPRLRERAFAILPLLDVAPEATDPVTGEPYRLLIAGGLSMQGVRCVQDSGWARGPKG